MRDEAGQGMTEYIIIVCLVAVAAIFVVRMFGTQIKRAFIFMTQRLSGQDTAAYNATAGNRANTDAGEVDFDKITAK
jgi:Flp pilus assembly pilin Flp